MPSSAPRGRQFALGFVFLWFLIGGIAHFVATEVEMRIVPPFIPWPHAVVLVSGAFELLGTVGLLWRPTRRAAGIGLFLLTIAVTPANVYMAQHAQLFNIPGWALWLRLPLQVLLLALIAWSSFARTKPNGRMKALQRKSAMLCSIAHPVTSTESASGSHSKETP
jgi:uncharacterized membrane protein